MSVSLIVCFIVGAGLAASGTLAWIRFREYRKVHPQNRLDEEFSSGGVARYQPMARLLGGEDAEFLRQNANCPKVLARWQRSRTRIIRLYLRELAADFQLLHARARALVAESPAQYSGLVPILMRQQIAFWKALAMIELRLTFGGARFDAEKLVLALEATRQEVSRAAKPTAA